MFVICVLDRQTFGYKVKKFSYLSYMAGISIDFHFYLQLQSFFLVKKNVKEKHFVFHKHILRHFFSISHETEIIYPSNFVCSCIVKLILNWQN